MPEGWRIERVIGAEGLARLAPVWDLLVGEMPERAWHHSYASHRAYFEHLSAPERFVGLVLRDGEGEVRAICPFEERRRSILGVDMRIWELPWDLHTRIRDVICPPGEARTALLPALRRYLGRGAGAPPVVVLARVTERGAAWACLDTVDGAAVCRDRHGAADVVDTTLSMEEQAARRSRKFRANLRRAQRKLDEVADVRYVHATDGTHLEAEYRTFLELEAAGWKGADGTGTALLLEPEVQRYYRELVDHFPGTEVTSIHGDGTCLASTLCARNGRDYGILKVCYNEDHAQASPGKLLLDHVLERCTEDPEIDSFNLVSHWEWCQDWKPDVLPAWSVYLAADDLRGALLIRALRARFRYGPRVKRWVGELRGGADAQG